MLLSRADTQSVCCAAMSPVNAASHSANVPHSRPTSAAVMSHSRPANSATTLVTALVQLPWGQPVEAAGVAFKGGGELHVTCAPCRASTLAHCSSLLLGQLTCRAARALLDQLRLLERDAEQQHCGGGSADARNGRDLGDKRVESNVCGWLNLGSRQHLLACCQEAVGKQGPV